MKKIIEFFKRLFGSKQQEVKPVEVSKPKPKRKPRPNRKPKNAVVWENEEEIRKPKKKKPRRKPRRKPSDGSGPSIMDNIK
tara:strand:- start:615 stop:857 length:243 start_codon:yes stop_codon:yes gene_type:complete